MKSRILIVDDEPRNVKIVRETVEGEAELRSAANGEDGLAAAVEFLPHLVLLDIMMPGIDGYETCRRIRANPTLAFTKVVLVSGKAMVDERLKGYEAGADDYVTKPYVPEELLAKCRALCRMSQLERRLDEINHSLHAMVTEKTRQLMDAQATLVTTAKRTALGEMAGGLAHEINTPLCTIGLVADQIRELAANGAPDVKTITELTGIVDETVGRITRVVLALKAFSGDTSSERFQDAKLKQLADDALVLCGERLKKANVRVGIEISDLLVAHCQPVQVSQLLLNLVMNSFDAISKLPERWIRVEAVDSGADIELSVTDSGKGIPAGSRDRLFQPFFTTKEIGKGTGLGLSISRGIAETNHGTLRLDPVSPHTRFVLRIPKGPRSRSAAS